MNALDPKRLIEALHASGIRFAIVGGMAAVVHGSNQVTQGLDIVAIVNPEEIEKLRRALAPLHPVHRMTPQKFSFLDVPEDLKPVRNLYLRTDAGVLDVISEVLGVGDADRVLRKAVRKDLFGYSTPIISIEDLITCKKLLGRSHDLRAVQDLEAVLLAKKK